MTTTLKPKRRSAANDSATTKSPLRLLTSVPICDGHDSAINAINMEFIRHGLEIIYLGYHRKAQDMVRAAIQEDVRAIGISSYNGGHVEFFIEVKDLLRKAGADEVGIFGGGGGTITEADAKAMQKRGVGRIFFAGTSLSDMALTTMKDYSTTPKIGKINANGLCDDRDVAKLLTDAVEGKSISIKRRSGAAPKVIGFAGPGGAGKTTLIDELVVRYLHSDPKIRIAILSHDPSMVDNGALLGDRATMIYAQNDRVYMRSLATRGQAGGLSEATSRCMDVLRNVRLKGREGGFDVILVETVGIGQESMPFGKDLVDQTVLVMSPDYGSRLQLQKIVAMDQANFVVVNKGDQARAKTATNEISGRLASNNRGQRLVTTVAKRHQDTGVDELFGLLNG